MIKNNKTGIITSIIITILTNLLSIPIKATTTYHSFYGRDNIINYIKNNTCKTCYNFSIDWLVLFIQTIIIFVVSYFILTVFNKRRHKNG